MLAGMELRQLRCFVAVAETGNISPAAKGVFLTQPALRRQIKALEAEIGPGLLERQAHSIRLTSAGETFAETVAPGRPGQERHVGWESKPSS